jgi:hypothetical protein
MRGKQRKRVKMEKQRRKRTMKSVLQPLETGVELAILRTPNAKLGGMLVMVELPKGGQLSDLGVAFLDLDALQGADLIHLGVAFCCEGLPLLGQQLIKLQL